MIVTFMEGETGEENKKLDVMVRPKQKIEDVYGQLLENGFLSGEGQKIKPGVYSVRWKEYVDPSQTFWQGKIYAGDILMIGGIQKISSEY